MISREFFTCCEGPIYRKAGHLSPAGHERDLILCVRVQLSQMVLGIHGGKLDCVPIYICDWAIGHRDPVHLGNRLKPGDKGCSVCHITHIHLAGSINHCG